MREKRRINRIVVTGATSTIGVALTLQAIKENIEVLAICSKGCKRLDRLPKSNLIKILECDISDYNGIVAGDERYDAFYHLAWLSSINSTERNNLYPQAKNIQYSLDAVELAARMGCQVFIGAGSQAEFGRKQSIIDEKTESLPENGYGMAKLCAEQMTRLACEQKGMEHVWPRIFSVYGPCCADYTVVQHIVKSLIQGESPALSGGDQIWDFLYFSDVGRAMLLLGYYGRNGEGYCVASGKPSQLRDYFAIIRAVVNPNIELGLGKIPYNESTVMHLEADISKLQEDTGFVPIVTFEEGIRQTVDWNKDYTSIF